MGRITLFIAALALVMAPGCKRDRTSQPAATPKTTEAADEAQDEAEAALETAREAKATADSALETAREAQAAARATSDAERISVSGQVSVAGRKSLVITPSVGAPLSVRIEPETAISVNGKAATAADLPAGAELRILYRIQDGQAVAERLDARR